MPFLLETKRLLIRPFNDSDIEPLFAYRNDPEVAKYQGWDLPYPREKAINWVAKSDGIAPTETGGSFSAALELKSTGEMIGDVGFMLTEHDVRQAHVGYSLARAYWRKRYGIEAVQRLLAYLFDELNLHRITAETDVLNESSWRLLERLGFRREAHLLENVWFKGDYESEYHYAMLKKEWEARNAPV